MVPREYSSLGKKSAIGLIDKKFFLTEVIILGCADIKELTRKGERENAGSLEF